MTTLPFTIEYMKERMQTAYKAGTLLAQADPDPAGDYYYRKEGSPLACAVGACFDSLKDIPTVNDNYRSVFDGSLGDAEKGFFANEDAFEFACEAQHLHDTWGRRLGKPDVDYEAKFRQHIGL